MYLEKRQNISYPDVGFPSFSRWFQIDVKMLLMHLLESPPYRGGVRMPE